MNCQQNFTQKDVTGVKIFQKVLAAGGYFFKHPVLSSQWKKTLFNQVLTRSQRYMAKSADFKYIHQAAAHVQASSIQSRATVNTRDQPTNDIRSTSSLATQRQ